jgi:hypothetical protein
MKLLALAFVLILACAPVCSAQDKPTGDCSVPYAGFAATPEPKVQIAEVASQAAVKLAFCDSEKGCFVSRPALGTPVLIYREQGVWTCGYFSSRDGAGPAWIRSESLRVVPYDARPPLKAWAGTWVGGEDRVLIRTGRLPGSLHLVGGATWQGQGGNAHFGDMKGDASPVGNHLRFVQNGPDSCTIDMTLLNRYILANDNQLCGGLNARFQGIWKRTGP